MYIIMKQNTTTNIFLACIAIVVLAFLGWYGLSRPRTTAQTPNQLQAHALSANPSVFDFGAIAMRDGNVSYTFRVKNEKSEPLLATKLYTSCMCTTAELVRKTGERFGPFGMPGHGGSSILNREIGPNEAFDLVVTFDPAAHGPAGIGPTTREIYAEDRTGIVLLLQIKANVKP